jgi:hypothetical protein
LALFLFLLNSKEVNRPRVCGAPRFEDGHGNEEDDQQIFVGGAGSAGSNGARELRGYYASPWAAISSIGAKIGCVAKTCTAGFGGRGTRSGRDDG